MTELVCVDPAKVAQVWPHVSGLIFIAMKRGDLSAFSDVQDAVLDGRALCWLAWDDPTVQAAAVTELHQTEWRRVLVIVACGGKDMRQWLPLLEGIEKYARAEGCKAVRIHGRFGWERVLTNYRPHRVVLERTL